MTKILSEGGLDEFLPKWMARVKEFEERFRRADLKRAALVVVDMQKEFLLEDAILPVWSGPAILPRLARLIDLCRSSGIPVIFTKHRYRNAEVDGGATGQWWGLRRDSEFLRADVPNTEIHEAIAPRNDEYLVLKNRYSGFFGTDLEAILRGLGARDVIIAGVASNCCCEATAHDAFFRDFHVFFLADGTGGSDEESHVAVLRDIAWTYGTVLTCAQVTSQIQEDFRS